MKRNEPFFTEDFQLATVLMYFHCSLEAISINSNSLRASFHFLKDKDLERIVEKFWKGNLSTEPLRLFQCYKTLKNRLNEFKRVNGYAN